MTIEFSEPRKFDVVSVGRVAVDFYGEQFGCDLEDISTFRKLLGGCPANIAVGAARLGLNVAMVSRVGSEHMGRFVLRALSNEGVNITQCKIDAERMTAAAVLCVKDKETFPLVYYRENCADLALDAEDVNEDTLAAARSVVITGTLCATRANSGACHAAIRHAKRHGTKIVFDIDYRPVLWGLTNRDMGEMRYVSSGRVTAALSEVIPHCDLVVGTEDEVHIAAGETETIQALRKLRSQTAATIVLKLGAKGCAVFESDIPESLDDALIIPGFPADVLNVLGAGDAFLAGLLRGWLGGESWERSCEFANACGAIVVSRNSCAPATPYWEELLEFIRTQGGVALRHQREFARLHRIIPRLERNEWLDIIDFGGAMNKELSAFFSLADNDHRRVTDVSGEQERRNGIIIDADNVGTIMPLIQAADLWVGRRVRLAVSDNSIADLGALKSWPQSHAFVASVSMSNETHLSESLAPLRMIYDLCCSQEREFVLEVNGAAITDLRGRLGRFCVDLSAANVFPDWWKLELSSPNDDEWNRIAETIAAADPNARIILGAMSDAASCEAYFRSKVVGGISIPAEKHAFAVD